MKISNKLLDIKILLFLSFLLLLLTNSYFSLEESIIYGARDGADYYILADNFQKIPNETLPYHKIWRFIIPSLIGVISEIFNLQTYLVFRITTIIACLTLITLFF